MTTLQGEKTEVKCIYNYCESKLKCIYNSFSVDLKHVFLLLEAC